MISYFPKVIKDIIRHLKTQNFLEKERDNNENDKTTTPGMRNN